MRPYDRFPRQELVDRPTPLESMPHYGKLLSHEKLYIKRDDSMPLGLGGNKLRHLEFWLGEALQEGADILVACGRPESNQCRLTAAAAARLGLRCILVHNTARPSLLQGNILLSSLFGAESHYLGEMEEDERQEAALSLIAGLRKQGHHPYLIGNVPLGALGYVKAAYELQEQARAIPGGLQHLVIVGAMGATAAGFLFGTALLGWPFHVHVISVEYDKPTLAAILERNRQDIAALLGVTPRLKEDKVSIYEEYLGPGYAVSTPDSLQALRNLARTEGILLEPTYTAKTLLGLEGLIKRGIIPPHEAACVLHTGGTPHLFYQAELLQ